jgi:TonB family protein
MKIPLCVVLVFFCLNLLAQNEPIIIKRDTINLHGYVFDERGKPIKDLQLTSSQLDLVYNMFHVVARTDTNGYFELRGAKLYDTITIQKHPSYHTPLIYNKDSRYMVIYLMSNINDINSSKPIEITHKRSFAKVMPSFKIEPFDHGMDFFEVHIPSHFPGGVEAFENYIKDNLVYPDSAIKNNVEGTVVLAFTIEKDGTIVNIKTMRGIGYGCDEAAINVLKKCRHWQPAIEYGRPYITKHIVSVKFSLTDK